MTPGEIHLDHLREYADAINAMNKRRWFARPFYEYMSGGLVWSDETYASGETVNALRLLFHCRTQLLMRNTSSEWIDFWRRARAIVPQWVGLHPSRCTPSTRLDKIIAEGEKRLAADLATLESAAEENDVSPTNARQSRW